MTWDVSIDLLFRNCSHASMYRLFVTALFYGESKGELN